MRKEPVLDSLKPTADPFVFIEEVRDGYTRYSMVDPDSPATVVRRWEVFGKCDFRGDCLIGAVVDGVEIKDHDHLKELSRNGSVRLVSELDVPVTPEFKDCCPFTYNELDVDA